MLDSGRFIRDTLCTGQIRQVWHFPFNAGLQFNNRTTGFIRQSYTIELFFEMENLSSYKRIVDFKNRKTDKGAYLYSSFLNFYNIATSNQISFAPKQYGYYVITRDSATQRVRIYSSGQAQLSFIDIGGDALLDTAQKLNFFQDDLAVQREASAGNAALITLFNRALDSAQIFSRFTNVCNILSVDDAEVQIPARLSPNPAHDALAVALDPSWLGANYRVVSPNGAVLQVGALGSVSNRLTISGLAPGLYVLQIEHKGKQRSLRFQKE